MTWIVPEFDPALIESLARRLKVSPILAQVLANRGLTDVAPARAFLTPTLNDLHDPAALDGVAVAAERVQRAVVERQRILLYGDYDVDGITAAALLWHLLRMAHADVRIYVPHRVDEGYGVKREAVEAAAADGTHLMITVDCGITAVDEIARANELGLDTIVTDHHEPDAALPPALAVIDPKREGSTYPFSELSGVGLAFKLAWAIAQQFSPGRQVSPPMRAFLLDALGLVALGTVADVVPLVGENRVMVHFGLQALAQSQLPGVRALLSVSGIDAEVSSHHVAFQLAPRINAAGRIGHADLAVELLTTADAARAVEIAAELEAKNRERQRMEQVILQQAQEAVGATQKKPGGAAHSRRSIVLADPRWHAGIIGIVASRLVSEWHCPVILIAADQSDDREALSQGSGRSIPGFDLFAALSACRAHLARYGGHAQAAGCKLKTADIPAFAEAFEAYCQTHLTDDDLLPKVPVDAEVDFDDLTAELMASLERLTPFGQGNRRPVLATREARICGTPRRVGQGGKHLALYLRHGATTRRAVGFDMGARLAECERLGPFCDVAYGLRPDRLRGDGVELHLRDIRFPLGVGGAHKPLMGAEDGTQRSLMDATPDPVPPGRGEP
jgi:single-stranded-DNA-specific exonuclease